MSSRRTAAGQRKGDLREQQILDAAEGLLDSRGYFEMTVNEIAEAAGITRSALYFYFGSKQDVVTALVARTVQALRDKSEAARNDPADPETVVATALDRTLQLWLKHSVVMRAAVDLSSTIPEIDELWTGAADIFIEAIAKVLMRMGVPAGSGPGDAHAVAEALCWMIERTFYQASKNSVKDLELAKQTCQIVWTQMMQSRSADHATG
ncbi:TetR family transcriptional regulator [Mycobacteroides franklinii]|uniref:TetR family transcriptional regulator n=1 Tax=Mycobacteroides franklinii TaxID=948102 RepID=A0A1S1L645_9MYCO|nr:TetR/AcrR family transcriptional regulator [Mycobacteroides franklinii]OHU19170.1 TetR family transcriptional regulator [Mycobacteroides franklinii]